MLFFCVQEGKVKLNVVSSIGKEATIALLNEADFFGQACLTGQPLPLCSAIAMTDCSLTRIGKESMAKVLHRERELLVARRHYQAHTFVSVVTSLVRLMFDTPCAP